MAEDNIFDQNSLNELPSDLNTTPTPEHRSIWQFIKDNKIVFSSVLAGIVVLGVFWYFISGSSTAPNPVSDNVILLIKGPEKLTAGNEADYKIIYRNGENADLINVSLEVIYPSDFKFKSASESTSNEGRRFNLPLLKQGDDQEVSLRGKLSGSVGEQKEIKARLTYKLSNFNSEFSVEKSFKTEILPPNFTLDILGPVEVSSGQDTTFSLNYANVSGIEYDNMAIKLTYPGDFKFTSANPVAPKDNDFWSIGKLALGSSSKIDISGSFTGAGEEKLVLAEIGQVIGGNFAPLVATSATFKVTKSPLTLTQSAEPSDVVNLGSNIQFTLKYANDGQIGMTNAVITLKLDGSVVDLSRIQVPDAVVTGNVLTWKAATFPNLSVVSPGEEGTIDFSVPIKNTVAGTKEQLIKSSASIYSAEAPKAVHAQDLEIKLATELALSISGDYISGAMPMKVGSLTTLSITLLLTNLSNDLANTEIIASIPLPVSAWKNVIIPESEKSRLTFDPNSGKIRWKIGDLPAFTGKYTQALKVSFQLGITPTENDKGKVMDLLKDITASGHDTFTDQDVQIENMNDISVSELDDDLIDSKGATVE